MKVNNDGTQSGSWYFGGIYNEVGNYAQEINGGYFVSGYTESFGRGSMTFGLLKLICMVMRSSIIHLVAVLMIKQ